VMGWSTGCRLSMVYVRAFSRSRVGAFMWSCVSLIDIAGSTFDVSDVRTWPRDALAKPRTRERENARTRERTRPTSA